MEKIKKINEILPEVLNQKSNDNQLDRIKNDQIELYKSNQKFVKEWEKMNDVQKLSTVKDQTKGLTKTIETVNLIGRVNAGHETKVLFLMVADLFAFFSVTDRAIIKSVTELLADEYGLLAIQDFALFFKKIKTGEYGEVYGKLSGGWITSKLNNFFKSVNYNYTVNNDIEHFEYKTLSGARDLDNYYDDIKLENLE